MNSQDGRWVYTAGLVLVRQKPGSAKGVMCIIIEDETGPANLVVWPALFEKHRRVVLGSSMMVINGRIQGREVVHLVAQRLFNLSGDLVGLADRDKEFRLPAAAAMSSQEAEDPIHGISRSRWSPRATCSCLTFTSVR